MDHQSKFSYKKTRDRALLPSVFVALIVGHLWIGQGLWRHNTIDIGDGLIYCAGAGVLYYVYRKSFG